MRRRDVLSGLAATAAVTTWPWQGHASAAKPRPADLLSAANKDVPPVAPPALAGRLANARRAFRASHYDDLANQLAELIAAAAATRRHREGGDRDAATGVLAASYRLASELCVKRNDDALAWVLADRGLATARSSGQPAPIALASRSVAIAMRRAGHHDDAVALLSTNATQLQPGGRPTDADLATYGSLLCTAAYARAQAGNRGDAGTLIAEATDAASRVAASVNAGEVMFSPTNVAVYKIGIYTALDDSVAALEHASTVDVRLSSIHRSATRGTASTPPEPGNSTGALTEPPTPCTPPRRVPPKNYGAHRRMN